jgi:RNA polymerase sigma-70 factor (ECF subfamily)
LLEIANQTASGCVEGGVGDHTEDALVDQLVNEHQRAYRAAWLVLRDRQLAEDAVQEAFLRVWRFRGSLPTGEAIRPWLYRVVVNTAISALRHERPRHDREAAAATEDIGAHDPVEAIVVAEALADLPEHLRIPVVLRYWVGLSEKEIATAISRRPGTVKSRLHEARTRLASDLRLAREEA